MLGYLKNQMVHYKNCFCHDIRECVCELLKNIHSVKVRSLNQGLPNVVTLATKVQSLGLKGLKRQNK